jgi:hypothetical protein
MFLNRVSTLMTSWWQLPVRFSTTCRVQVHWQRVTWLRTHWCLVRVLMLRLSKMRHARVYYRLEWLNMVTLMAALLYLLNWVISTTLSTWPCQLLQAISANCKRVSSGVNIYSTIIFPYFVNPLDCFKPGASEDRCRDNPMSAVCSNCVDDALSSFGKRNKVFFCPGLRYYWWCGQVRLVPNAKTWWFKVGGFIGRFLRL